jgi:hypothetical protein
VIWTPAKFFVFGVFILFWFQASTPNSASSGEAAATTSALKAPGDAATTVSPEQAVITVHGVCEQAKGEAAANGNGCTTVVTRARFETLMDGLNPPGRPVSARTRQNVAQIYAESLRLELAARTSGMEDTDEFRELMAWARLQVAAEVYRKKLAEKYANPAQEEIDAFYHHHIASYERVKISRVLVPRANASAPDNGEFDKKALEAINKVRTRVLHGEDPDLVQKDIYSNLGLSSPPPAGLGRLAQANFIDKEGSDVFALKPGEVSQVEIEPKSYVIYKLEAKETLPEAEVKTEISKEISKEKFDSAIKAAADAAPTTLDERYFGPGANASLKAPTMPATPPTH